MLEFWPQMRHWILLVLAIGSADAAQIQIGTLVGAVRDPSQAAVAEAQVVLYDATSNFERFATTDDRGQFQLTNLPFGQYAVRIDANGFRPFETTIAVRSNLTLTLEVALEIAGPREELTVRAAAPLVEPDQARQRVHGASARSAPGKRHAGARRDRARMGNGR